MAPERLALLLHGGADRMQLGKRGLWLHAGMDALKHDELDGEALKLGSSFGWQHCVDGRAQIGARALQHRRQWPLHSHQAHHRIVDGRQGV